MEGSDMDIDDGDNQKDIQGQLSLQKEESKSSKAEFTVKRLDDSYPAIQTQYDYYDRQVKYIDYEKINLKIFKLWRLPFLHPAFYPFL